MPPPTPPLTLPAMRNPAAQTAPGDITCSVALKAVPKQTVKCGMRVFQDLDYPNIVKSTNVSILRQNTTSLSSLLSATSSLRSRLSERDAVAVLVPSCLVWSTCMSTYTSWPPLNETCNGIWL